MGMIQRESRSQEGLSAATALEGSGKPFPWLIGLALGAAICVRWAIGLVLGFLPFDDTFITLRYARNLVAGHGFVFNVGEHVLGTTAPFWALLIGLLMKCGIGAERAAFLLSLSADAVATAVLAKLLWFLFARVRLVVIFVAISLSFVDLLTLSRAGMESSLFSALAAASLYSMLRSRPNLAFSLAALSVGFRPEGLGVVAAVLIVSLKLQPRDQIVRSLSVALVPLLAWAAFATWRFGSVVPQSIAAKAHQVSVDPGLRDFSWMNLRLFLLEGQFGDGPLTRTPLQGNLLISVFAVVGLAAALRLAVRGFGQATTALVGLAMVPVGFVAAYAVAGGFTWFAWYYELPTRFGLLWASVGIAGIGAETRARHGWGGLILPTCFAAVIVALQGLSWALVKSKQPPNPVVSTYMAITSGVPNDFAGCIGALEVGAVGWVAWPRKVVDLLGLTASADLKALSPQERLRASQPTFLILRENDAAELLKNADKDLWLSSTYVLEDSVRPSSASEFFYRFRRRDLSPLLDFAAAGRGECAP